MKRLILVLLIVAVLLYGCLPVEDKAPVSEEVQGLVDRVSGTGTGTDDITVQDLEELDTALEDLEALSTGNIDEDFELIR